MSTAILSEKVRAFLEERRFAVLGTINADGTPQLSAMWYQLEGDHILMNTKAGRVKERNLRRDPRVSICFEDGGYLTVTGKATLIDDQETAQRDIHRLAVRYNDDEKAAQSIEEVFAKEQRVSIHISIERVIENLW
jgi:PPOX class probable F420-dependent enzyme